MWGLTHGSAIIINIPDPALGKTSWGHRQNLGGSNPLTWQQLMELS